MFDISETGFHETTFKFHNLDELKDAMKSDTLKSKIDDAIDPFRDSKVVTDVFIVIDVSEVCIDNEVAENTRNYIENCMSVCDNIIKGKC